MDHQVIYCANTPSCGCMRMASASLSCHLTARQTQSFKYLTRDEIAKKLDIGRMVFLIVVLIDYGGLALAMIMRGMSDHPYR